MEKIPSVLSTLKNKVDKLDVGKLIHVPKDLSKLRDVVKMMLLKKMLIKMLKDKIPDITNSATTNALTAVENKISNVRNLVKKADYNTKLNEIEKKTTINHDHDKYSTTQEFIKLT